MAIPLNILIVEDSETDAALLLGELRSAGYEASAKRVETETDYLASLQSLPDLIIADYRMPRLNGLRAMDLLRKRGLDVPLILVSGIVGEDQTVEAMQYGVTDYLLKDRLGRLGNAVKNTLEQKRLRQERGRTQEQLALQAMALGTAANGIMITDRAGKILWVNPAFTTVTGYAAADVIGNTPRVLKSGKHDKKFYQDFWQSITSGETWRGEFINRKKDGSLCYDEHTVTPVRSQAGMITHFVGIMNDVTAQKRAEEDLHASHAQLRQLLEHSPAVIYSLKVDGQSVRPVTVSENITELLGFSVAESLSYEWLAGQLHPQDRDKAIASISETITRGISRTEYRMRHKNGDYRWVQDHKRLSRGSSNQSEQIVGVWTDITEHKRAEEVLREVSGEQAVQRKMSAAKDLAIVLVVAVLAFAVTWRLNLFHVPLHWIVKHEETGLDEAIVGLVVMLLGMVWFGFRRWHQISRHTHVEETLLRLHGALETRIQQRTAELSKANEALRAEITRRKESEGALQRVANIVESSNDSIIGETLDGKVTSWNKAAEKIFGYSAAEMIGQPVARLLPPNRVGEEPAILDRINLGEGMIYLETRRLRKDGVQIDVAVTISPIKDAEGKIVGASKIGRDISLQKRQAAELEEVQKQLRETAVRIGRAEMARTVVHNIGNVLNGIGVSTTLIAQKIHNSKGSNIGKLAALLQQHTADLSAFLSTDPKGKKVPAFVADLAEKFAAEQRELTAELQLVGEKVAHIRTIIDTHQTSTSVSGLTEQVGASDLVEAALRLNSASLESRGVRVIRQFSATPLLATEKHKVLQILVNLITNATQALEQGRQQDRQLTCQIDSEEQQRVRISVTDNGMGISAENLPRIFQQGFTTRQGGHGLGLHGSASLAKELGGDLTVTSGGPGQGAVFTLELPIQSASRPPDRSDGVRLGPAETG